MTTEGVSRRRRIAVGAIVVVIAALAACTPKPRPSPSSVPSPTVAPPTPAAVVPSPSATVAPSVAPSTPPSDTPIPGGWTLVKSAPCPDSDFECVTLAVPRDHFIANGPTWEVTFGILHATGKKKGTFVTASGGPGYSGLSVADSYTSAFPEGITDVYDVVFFDQRGIGMSRPFQCPNATGEYYDVDADPADPAGATAFKAAAESYVTRCITETGADPADLPYFATRQAVEDLEAFREYLKVDKVDLYGESYGTQYAQMYATSHPDRIANLYLDGPVDLTLDGASFYAEAARAFDDDLIWTLTACAADKACAADFEGVSPLDVYDELASKLSSGPISYDFIKADGSTEARTFTQADLATVAVSYLFGPFDRMMLVRALAAAVDGDYTPLARAAAISIALDPETLAVVPDPTYSDAMYYAVECQDYVYFPDAGDLPAQADAYLGFGHAAGLDPLRLDALFYQDMPCIYWPNRPTVDPRPAPIVDAPYRTFVLVATADPITPVANAHRLVSRLSDVYLILTEGGPHVTFGWGEACPDELIGAYMVKGKRPASRITTCANVIADDYIAVGRDAAADYADALALMSSMDDQVTYTNDYQYQLDAEPLAVGCDFGGSITYTPTDTGTDLALDACAFTDDVAMTGSGAFDDDSGGLTLDVRFRDGVLRYTRSGDYELHVTGTFRGAKVDLTG
ncbi:MAG TPA: alpha/beta hydrolase [Candidatus Limnocylindrales bacterium]